MLLLLRSIFRKTIVSMKLGSFNYLTKENYIHVNKLAVLFTFANTPLYYMYIQIITTV